MRTFLTIRSTIGVIPALAAGPARGPWCADETDERAGRWSGSHKTECGLHTIEQDGSGI